MIWYIRMEKIHFQSHGQMLHAKSIEFVHPTKNEKIKIEAKIPKYFEEVIKKLEES